MNHISSVQGQVRKTLSAFVNNGALSRPGLLLSVLFPWLAHKRMSSNIVSLHSELIAGIHARGTREVPVSVEYYESGNPAVQKMMDYLSLHLQDDLVGAYVHGSLGTCEELPYSDFDALVIIKNEVLRSESRLSRVARNLRSACGIMYEYDPVQHHGWFVLTEADLSYYNDSYFPLKLFEYSRSLLKSSGRELKVYLRDSGDEAGQAFQAVASSLQEKLENKRFPVNVYQLKSMLSEFMLLPALYYQADNRQGIFKKESFGVVEEALHTQYWRSMSEASLIREEWGYEISQFRRWLLTRVHPMRKYLAERFAPGIPAAARARLTGEFYSDMKRLVILMREKHEKLIG